MAIQVYEQGVPYISVQSLGIEVKSGSENSEYPMLIHGPFSSESVEIDVSKLLNSIHHYYLMAPRTDNFFQ